MSFPLLILALALAGAVARPALCADACPPASAGAAARVSAAGSPGASATPAAAPDAAGPGESPAPVDVNRASAEELQRLPGIGPRKAAALLEARAVRPFRRASDLRRVKGFGARTVQRLAPLMRFE